MMNVCFRTISNQVYYLKLNPTDTISEVKQKLYEKYQIEPSKTKLIYKAKILNDQTTLESNRFDNSGFIVINTFVKRKSNTEINQNINKKSGIEITQENESNANIDKNDSNSREIDNMANSNPTPSVEPLPFILNSKFPDPPNFQENVKKLTSMGFHEGDCEMAIRASFGDLDRAVEFLISGNIPDVSTIISSNNIPIADSECEESNEYSGVFFMDDNNEEEEEDENQNLIHFRDELIKNPQKIKIYLDTIAKECPSVAGLISDSPRSFLLSIGLNPNDFDLTGIEKRSQYEELISKFTKEERENIHILENLGYDTMTIIQVFEACDKNLEKTKLCLESMK